MTMIVAMWSNTVKVFLTVIILAPTSEGSKEVFTVTCDHQQISDVEDFYMNANSSSSDTLSNNYCINGNCFNSFDDIVENLTTDNSVLNITCNVELSSVIELTSLTNVTITGYNNATIDCNNNGGLRFTSCSNVTIEGIIWEQCGSNKESDLANPVIKFHKTSNVMIQNSKFQYSVGQAVVLTEISENVMINYCEFVNNSKYTGYGAVIYHSSVAMINNTVNLSITNSHFQGNVGASIIHLQSSKDSTSYYYFLVETSTFIDNANIIFYLVNQDLYM